MASLAKNNTFRFTEHHQLSGLFFNNFVSFLFFSKTQPNPPSLLNLYNIMLISFRNNVMRSVLALRIVFSNVLSHNAHAKKLNASNENNHTDR